MRRGALTWAYLMMTAAIASNTEIECDPGGQDDFDDLHSLRDRPDDESGSRSGTGRGTGRAALRVARKLSLRSVTVLPSQVDRGGESVTVLSVL